MRNHDICGEGASVDTPRLAESMEYLEPLENKLRDPSTIRLFRAISNEARLAFQRPGELSPKPDS